MKSVLIILTVILEMVGENQVVINLKFILKRVENFVHSPKS